MRRVRLATIAYARSGDKGSTANIGVAVRSRALFDALSKVLTAERVAAYFGLTEVVRYELPNLNALNFVLPGILQPLAVDSQGKCLGQQILEMRVEIPEELL